MPDFSARMLVIDIETTGTETDSARICEFGGAYFEERDFVESRRTLVNPGTPIPAPATKIHGITDDLVADQPTFAEVADRFIAHFDGTALDGERPVLAGYNAVAFDVPIINAEFTRSGLDAALDPTVVVDPVVFVRWHLRHLRYRRLEAMCDYFNIVHGSAHSAAADARATGELLLAMVEAGIIPDDAEEALSQQTRYAAAIEKEFRRWSFWIYRDRNDGTLRIGAGKHAGAALAEVDRGYLEHLLTAFDELPTEVRKEFQRIADGA